MTHPSPVLTTSEACVWLRLDVDFDGDLGRAEDALRRITARGELRPVKGCGKRLRFHIDELQRYARAATLKAAADYESEGNPASDGRDGQIEGEVSTRVSPP